MNKEANRERGGRREGVLFDVLTTAAASTLSLGILVGMSLAQGCAMQAGDGSTEEVGVQRAALSSGEQDRVQRAERIEDPTARLRALAELANEMTRERATRDGVLSEDGRRIDRVPSRGRRTQRLQPGELERRYAGVRRALLEGHEEDEQWVLRQIQEDIVAERVTILAAQEGTPDARSTNRSDDATEGTRRSLVGLAPSREFDAHQNNAQRPTIHEQAEAAIRAAGLSIEEEERMITELRAQQAEIAAEREARQLEILPQEDVSDSSEEGVSR